jgi:hypothetical protein
MVRKVFGERKWAKTPQYGEFGKTFVENRSKEVGTLGVDRSQGLV